MMASNDAAFTKANFEIVQPMFNELSSIIQNSVTTNFQTIMQLVSPLFGAAVILYGVFFAWEIMYTRKDDVMMESVKRMGVLTLVFAMTTAGGMYLSYIVPFVQGSGQEVASRIIGQDGASTGAVIDGLLNRLIDLGIQQFQVFKDTEGWFDSMGAWAVFILKAIALTLAGGGFVIYCAAYLLMAEMMVGILLSIGGVFIFFSAWPTTRNMFTAWVGSCFNYIFLNIAYACLFKVLIQYINNYININSDAIAENIWSVLCIALVFLIGKFLLAQISALISTLTGGVGINGLTSATGDAIKALRGIGNNTRNQLGLGFNKTATDARERNREYAAAAKDYLSSRFNGNIKAG
ncbi:type IV secretion system protein [Escherichia coli]